MLRTAKTTRLLWAKPWRNKLQHRFTSSSSSSSTSSTKITTVYGMGDGWTGALGTGRLDQSIMGHHDDDDDAFLEQEQEQETSAFIPMLETRDTVLSCDVGWGHTALIVQDTTRNHTKQQQQQQPPPQLLLTGRPHEISSLFRLRRLPEWFRNYAVGRTHSTTNKRWEDKNLLHPVELIGEVITSLSNFFMPEQDWEQARAQSIMSQLTPVAMPSPATSTKTNHTNNKQSGQQQQQQSPSPIAPIQVVCSAGWTALLGQDQNLYTFGLNAMGQCGVGFQSNNVWKPTKVTGLSSAFASGQRQELPQSHPIVQMALGLQHGLCLNSIGEVFSWGKGDRGQLGHDNIEGEIHAAIAIQKVLLDIDTSNNNKPTLDRLGPVSQIASGLIHSAALERDTNRVFVWGKNIMPLLPKDRGHKVASDANLPKLVKGLPNDETVLQIACGSHHTAFLLSDGSVWAIGIATDTKRPIHTPICLIPGGSLKLPLRQFAAHMDRTTVIDANDQIFQVHLWEEAENQQEAVFTPFWVDRLLDEQPEGVRIREIHRSWLHTVVVTERDDCQES